MCDPYTINLTKVEIRKRISTFHVICIKQNKGQNNIQFFMENEGGHNVGSNDLVGQDGAEFLSKLEWVYNVHLKK